MTTTASTRSRLTRYLAGTALALGLALGSAAVANAVWDIEVYDSCLAAYDDPDGTGESQTHWVELCCYHSGGNWKPGQGCFAPGVDSQGRNPLPTHVMQPSPLPSPPGDIGPAPGGVLTPSP